MSGETKRELLERGVRILEVFGVVVAYLGILALLIWPDLDARGLLP